MQTLPQGQSEVFSRLRVHSRLRSRFLPDERDVIVYLPPGYGEDADRRYPVLYMQDGQNLFGGDTIREGFVSWRMAETADAAIQAEKVEPLIIAGIAHAGERRMAEYTPTSDWKLGGGEADRYGRLIVEELMPLVAENYRIKTGPENTGLGGSSLGGLVSLYLGRRYDDVFGKLAVFSPSVWWNHRAILSLVSDPGSKLRKRSRIWLDVGQAEGQRAVADTDLLARKLRVNGWSGTELQYQRIAGGTHDEGSWGQRVGPMLRFLFPA